jgi:hypothetical protein
MLAIFRISICLSSATIPEETQSSRWRGHGLHDDQAGQLGTRHPRNEVALGRGGIYYINRLIAKGPEGAIEPPDMATAGLGTPVRPVSSAMEVGREIMSPQR